MPPFRAATPSCVRSQGSYSPALTHSPPSAASTPGRRHPSGLGAKQGNCLQQIPTDESIACSSAQRKGFVPRRRPRPSRAHVENNDRAHLLCLELSSPNRITHFQFRLDWNTPASVIMISIGRRDKQRHARTINPKYLIHTR